MKIRVASLTTSLFLTLIIFADAALLDRPHRLRIRLRRPSRGRSSLLTSRRSAAFLERRSGETGDH